jgi:ubiquinone/menaquinone biosynthesis C-methylase UbiE
MSDRHGEAPSDENELQRVAACWDRTAKSRQDSSLRGWLDSYAVASERLNARASGSPHVNWLIGLVERLGIPSSSRWLSVGCGAAGQEIIAAENGLFAHLEAIDLSPVALEEARRTARAKGVENVSFREADFHQLEPPAESYDVIFMNMSLHHVKDLDSLLSRIAAALRPEGFFLINEYVGPSQFQFGELQLSIVRDLLGALPEELRQDVATGKVKREYERKPVEFWNVVDPSEAIRSAEIVPALDRHFQVVERIDYGGTVLHLLLEHIIHNFDNGDPYHLAVLRLLGTIEDILISQGVLRSDFSLMALAKKDASHPRRAPGETPEAAAPRSSEVEALSRELTRAYEYIRDIESSRGWRLLERLRGFLGVKWGKG